MCEVTTVTTSLIVTKEFSDSLPILNKKTIKDNLTVFNRIIIDILNKKNIGFRELTKMITKAFPDFSISEVNRYRNTLIHTVTSKRISVSLFKKIMTKILKESIPQIDEVHQQVLLGSIGKALYGKRFDRLVVLKCVGRNNRSELLWQCKCDCGNTVVLKGATLRLNSSHSCGCDRITKQRESLINHYKELGKYHGQKGSPTYITWRNMRARCYNPKHDNYKYYGGAGITVCDRWCESFVNFLEDMGERPDGMTIDRIDRSGNYEPCNCKWATKDTQEYNKRTTIYFDDGTPVGLWAKENELPYHIVLYHYKKGRSKEAILERAK
jgi:hypothetical protein